jgi:hypothetical protein
MYFDTLRAEATEISDSARQLDLHLMGAQWNHNNIFQVLKHQCSCQNTPYFFEYLYLLQNYATLDQMV